MLTFLDFRIINTLVTGSQSFLAVMLGNAHTQKLPVRNRLCTWLLLVKVAEKSRPTQRVRSSSQIEEQQVFINSLVCLKQSKKKEGKERQAPPP